MKVALAQLDPVVGDVVGNADRIEQAVRQARVGGASILLTPELSLVGYPPRDLLERRDLGPACVEALERLARSCGDLAVLVGTPRQVPGDPRPWRNSMALLRGGRIEAFADKILLPTYDVFDEERHFTSGGGAFSFSLDGRRVGIALCEDLWQADDVGGVRGYARDPIAELASAGVDLILAASASPFLRQKDERRGEHLRQVARRARVQLVLVNQVGANDELVFDGASRVVDADGSLRARLPSFREVVEVVDLAGPPGAAAPAEEPLGELFAALCCGVGGYVRKSGHERVLLGLSGGIDSALVATIAAAALGGSKVRGVMLPSRHSSAGSLADARELARRLGLGALEEVPIEAAHRTLREVLQAPLGEVEGLVDENLQSRLRGVILMALSNARGELLLTTGNKSEHAVGYATLYGDMCGALAPIGDLLKTDVWDLARWINARARGLGFAEPPIPENSIEKAPSAELRPNQTDQDSLPPYPVLDLVVEGWVVEERSAEEIARSSGIPLEEVRRITAMIDRAEFKRRQAPPILKTSRRSFGTGRPMPIAARWRPASR